MFSLRVGGAARPVLEPVGCSGGCFFLGLLAGFGGVVSPPFLVRLQAILVAFCACWCLLGWPPAVGLSLLVIFVVLLLFLFF